MKNRYPQDSKLKFSVKTFNAKSARKFLEEHEGPNRPQGSADIKRYAQLMVSGEWALTHQGIAVSTEGNLIDGQHRLEAICYAKENLDTDVSVKLVVATGLDPSVFDILDQGRNRKAKDAFSIEGREYPAVLEVAVRLHWIRVNGKRVKGTGKLRIAEMQDHLKQYPEIETAVQFIMEELATPVKVMGMTPGYASALYAVQLGTRDDYDMDESDYEQMAKEFWKKFVDDDVDHPICSSDAPRIVRKYILKQNSNTETKLTRDALVDLLVSAWNAFASDEEVKGISSIKPMAGTRPEMGTLDSLEGEE
jgi:hypothetical protein